MIVFSRQQASPIRMDYHSGQELREKKNVGKSKFHVFILTSFFQSHRPNTLPSAKSPCLKLVV